MRSLAVYSLPFKERVATLLLFKKLSVLSVPLFFEVFGRDEAQGCGIHAIAEPCGRRAVIEYVPEMGICRACSSLLSFW